MQRDTRYYSLIGSLIARTSRTRTKKVQRVETVIGPRLLRLLRRPIEIDHRERNGVSRVFRSCKHAGSSTSFPGFTLLFPSNESEKKKSRDVTRLDQRSHRFRWTRSQLQAIKTNVEAWKITTASSWNYGAASFMLVVPFYSFSRGFFRECTTRSLKMRIFCASYLKRCGGFT